MHSYVIREFGIYGRVETVRYRCVNLLWGKGIYQELRFVLVVLESGERSILVSTDLTLSAAEIIELYGHRFKIESCFREFKQQFGGFSYHFWTKALPKLNHFKRKNAPEPVDSVTDEHDRDLVLRKLKAIEGFVLVANIAMGLTQMAALNSDANQVTKFRYLRTTTPTRISEATVICFFRKQLFAFLINHPDSPITRSIRERQTRDYAELKYA